MPAWLVLLGPLLLQQLCCPGVNADNPFDPHSSSSLPFMEGWYIRITDSRSSSFPASLAFGIGHLPDQHPQAPAAACFLVMSPRQDDPAEPNAPHNQYNSSSSSSSSSSSPAPPQKFIQYFSVLDVHASKQQAGCVDCPAFVATGSNAQGSCRLEVTGPLISIKAEVKGSVQFSASNDPSSAYIVPWGASPSSSPEGWLPPGLLKLHWYVYSMASPITYNLTIYNPGHTESTGNADNAENAGGVAVVSGNGNEQPRRMAAAPISQEHCEVSPAAADNDAHTEAASAPEAVAQASEPGPGGAHHAHLAVHSLLGVSYVGSGFTHMEKNWGAGFPDAWVWTQGTSSDGKASFVLAGGSLPIAQPTGTLASAAVSAFKLFWRTIQRTTSTIPTASNSAAQFQAPLAFAFSFHSQDLNLTIDPFNLGVVTAFEPCGCCGSLAVTLRTWSHTVVLRVDAGADTFSPLPCPTEDGFRVKSDESFTATAHVRVYGASTAPPPGWFNMRGSRSDSFTAPSSPSAHSSSHSTKSAHAPAAGPDGVTDSNWMLLAGAVFEGAALEFGGSVRCAGTREYIWKA